MKTGLASIIILTWNTPNEVADCLKSLRKQTYKNFEVILVDNGSSEENIKKLKKVLRKKGKLKLRTVFNGQNLGFCEGNNVGFRLAKGEYIVFLSEDTIVDRDWLKYLLGPLSKSNNIGGSVSKVIFYGNKSVQFAGGRLKFYGKAVSEGLGERDSEKFNSPKFTFWGQGCSLAFRKNVLDKLDEVFCKQFFIYCDDLDLSWRVNNLGYKIMYSPKSFLYHKGSVAVERNADPGKFIREDQLYRNVRNKYLTFWRNLKPHKLILVMPFVLGYDLMKSLYFVVRGRTDFYGGRFNYMRASAGAFAGFLQLRSKVEKPRGGRLSDLDL